MDSGPGTTPIGSLSWPLDPNELDERLYRIGDVARMEYETDEQAFNAVQSMVFDLRLAIAKAASCV